ncbi:TetR/AcrR family transcriptional regulator [Sphingobium tyrosinilyticum]|uniref:Helix-turn-helix domain-containing protein n=1 Tax=Sphingobium tyrosinilyticum TaxID=2715436 RepID=A0ABV9F6A0_9SPHN
MEEAPLSRSHVKRTVGRPRRLTLEAIVDAACELGLARFEMNLLAERLNTGVATLYGYVRSKEELEQMMLQRLACAADVCESADTWQDLLREHAAASVRASEALPHLLANLVNGEPNERENAYATAVISKLSSCGLSEADAVTLYIEVTQTVIGAAICRARAKRLKERDPEFANRSSSALGDHRPTVERIIRDYELRGRD